LRRDKPTINLKRSHADAWGRRMRIGDESGNNAVPDDQWGRAMFRFGNGQHLGWRRGQRDAADPQTARSWLHQAGPGRSHQPRGKGYVANRRKRGNRRVETSPAISDIANTTAQGGSIESARERIVERHPARLKIYSAFGAVNFNGGNAQGPDRSIWPAAEINVCQRRGGRSFRLVRLPISGTGKIDLTDNRMIVDYSGASPIRIDPPPLLSTGRSTGNLGPATASPAAPRPRSLQTDRWLTRPRLGYAEASAIGITRVFGGIALDSTGDRHWVHLPWRCQSRWRGERARFQPAPGRKTSAERRRNWYQGDFNYDGTVNTARLPDG